MPGTRVSLESLPPEILQQIHLQAQNHHLPQVSATIHASLSPPYTSSYYIATYLADLYQGQPPQAILTRALRHRICTVQVAKDIKRIWDKRRDYIEPAPGLPPVAAESSSSAQDTISIRIPDPSPPRPTKPALSVSELPRRLFRNLTSTSVIPPLLLYLFETYKPNPNSFEGYALSRAVLSKNLEVIRYLLRQGADPGKKEGMAIQIAVKLGDLKIVRMLVEHQNLGSPNSGSLGIGIDIPSKWVETAVRSGSDEIVSYFVHEKGVMPPLHSIMQLGQASVTKKRKVETVEASPSRKKEHMAREESKSRHDERGKRQRTNNITKDKSKTRIKKIKTSTKA